MKELEFIISQDKLTLNDVKNILSKNLKLKLSNKSIERINTCLLYTSDAADE